MTPRPVRWTDRARELAAVAVVALFVVIVVVLAVWSGLLTGNLDPP